MLAVEGHKTPMKLVNALDSFGDSVWKFTTMGVNHRRQRDWGLPWTQWLGWAIPQVIKMLPVGTIPIPSIEVRSGGVEAGLYALSVQGLKNGGGVGMSLVPDEVVVKEWSEMKIDMADPPPTSTSDVNEGYSTNSTQPAFGTRKQRPSRPLRGYESTLTVYAPKLKEWDTTSSILSSVTVRMKMRVC